MKPQRNLVYCPSAKKHKQLFQSEKEAMAFIKYNSEEIKEATGKDIGRCYYCDFCLGWHITSTSESSKKFFTLRDKRINQAIDTHSKEIEEIKSLSKCIDIRIRKILDCLRHDDIKEAETLLEICELDSSEINRIGGHFLKSNRSERKISKIKDKIQSKKESLNLTTSEQTSYQD